MRLLSQRNFNNGLVAAIAGYCLFCLKYNLKKKKFLPPQLLNGPKLLQEVRNYSQDDVQRMELYYRYPGILNNQAAQVHYRQKILKINNNLMVNFKTIKNLQTKLQVTEKNLKKVNRATVSAKISTLETKQKKLLAELQDCNDKIAQAQVK